MNDWLDNEAMLDRFRQWLEETRREADALPDEAEASAEQSEARPVGLLQLVEEFTALRHEVKLQTKSSRGAGGTDRAGAGGHAAGDRGVPRGRGQGGGSGPSRPPSRWWSR